MGDIRLKLAAYTDCGGRPGKPNEDNFLVDSNLSDDEWTWGQNEVHSLTDKGALMVVSDGMGGMNAGDVASEIAIDIVKSFFVAENLTDTLLQSSDHIRQFLRQMVEEADRRIKAEGKNDPNKEGMGATIVLAWLIHGKAYICWCGDSRAYLYHPNTGLRQVSKDHSYVQDLVDSGQLLPELAFDHPNGNIITRSLGDPMKKAVPDIVELDLCKGDIIMLCSDGLSGVLRDYVMEQIIAENAQDIVRCKDALFEAAKNANWHDNTTVTLCRIESGCPNRIAMGRTNDEFKKVEKKKRVTTWIAVAFVVAILAVGAIYWLTRPEKVVEETSQPAPTTDFSNDDNIPDLSEMPKEMPEGEEPVRYLNQSDYNKDTSTSSHRLPVTPKTGSDNNKVKKGTGKDSDSTKAVTDTNKEKEKGVEENNDKETNQQVEDVTPPKDNKENNDNQVETQDSKDGGQGSTDVQNPTSDMSGQKEEYSGASGPSKEETTQLN